MKLIPAYQAEQEAKKVFEELCSKLYFDRLDSIEKKIEYWKNEGYFRFSHRFLREGNDAVNYKVEKMIKKHLEGYGYNVYIAYPDNNTLALEISWKKGFLSLLWQKIKNIWSKKRNEI